MIDCKIGDRVKIVSWNQEYWTDVIKVTKTVIVTERNQRWSRKHGYKLPKETGLRAVGEPFIRKVEHKEEE